MEVFFEIYTPGRLVAWRRADVNDSMQSGISQDHGSRMLWPPAFMLSCAMRRVW